ncbi:hypothetical protein K3495_g6729 [Podosphaera aphanis]|nr:hypothetical protein K3495_g6729 [Podosphaera aphanis]
MISKPTFEQLKSASIEELKEILNKTYNENKKLETAAIEARKNAAHHKLQFNLLTIESQEALNRLQVENFMLRQETEVLRQNSHNSARAKYIEKLREYCRFTENDNVITHHRLNKTKKIIKIQAIRLASAREEITLLKGRIRQNRQHINEMRSPGGPLHYISMPDTRSITLDKFCRTPGCNHSLKESHSPQCQDTSRKNKENLNALLLAGSILNQRSNSIPSTPVMAHFRPPMAPMYHNDKKRPFSDYSNSLCCSQNSNPVLLPSVQFNSDIDLDVLIGTNSDNYSRERRRTTRDSTISASDAEEIARHLTKTENDYENDYQQNIEFMHPDPSK